MPNLMPCPICGKEGRIVEYHPRKTSKSAARSEFCVAHEQLDHTWGTSRETKVQAVRRCYILKPHHRALLIAKVGDRL